MNILSAFCEPLPTLVRIHKDYSVTDQAYMIHLHRNVTEIVCILSGSGLYRIGTEFFHVSGGDILIIEGGFPHAGASSSVDSMETLAAVVGNINWNEEKSQNSLIPLDACPLLKSSDKSSYITQCFQELYRLKHLPAPADERIASMILLSALMCIHNHYRNAQPYWEPPVWTKAKEILGFLYDHYTEDLTLENLATHFFISESHLNRLLQEEFATSPINYLIDIRLSKAKSYLLHTNLSVAEIAYKVGYLNTAHFIRLFTRRIGYSPSNYRFLHKREKT